MHLFIYLLFILHATYEVMADGRETQNPTLKQRKIQKKP